jgi:ABC-type molybdate transport system ATPase subunit
VVSKLGITHVPEGRRLFGNLTVMENLQLATFARKDRDQVKKDIRRVFEIFPRLEERKSQASGTMSGGEQQMLAIGRAFMSGRRLMLLDEPSMGLVAAADDECFPGAQGDQPTGGNRHPAGGAKCPSGPEVFAKRICSGKWKSGASRGF